MRSDTLCRPTGDLTLTEDRVVDGLLRVIERDDDEGEGLLVDTRG